MASDKDYSVLEKNIIKTYGSIFFTSERLEETRGEMTPISLSLDIGLHGGILDGTIIGLSGVTGSGKTTLCLTYIANGQARGKTGYYIDVEGRLQPELIQSIPGLDPNKLKIIRSTKEKFLTAEDILNIINMIISTEPDVIIILDSVATLCADAAHSSSFGESKKMMSIPQLMYDLTRKAAQVLPSMRSNLVLITHIQANPSPYGGGFSEVGGNAIKYESSYRLQCLSSSETPKDGKKTGRESKFKILKTATGPGTGEAHFYIRYNKGYDRCADIVTLGEELGLIEKGGSWYSYILEGKDQVKIQGSDNLIEYLEEHKEDALELEKLIRGLTLPQKEVKKPVVPTAPPAKAKK